MKKTILMFMSLWFSLSVFAQADAATSDDGLPSPPNAAPSDAPLDEKTLKIKEDPEPTQSVLSQGSSADLNGWDFLRMFLILALVIGMIVGLVFLLRRFSGQSDLAVNTVIKVLHTQPLGANRALHVIEIGKETLLVGSGDASVSLIKEIKDQETIDAIHLAASQEKSHSLHFGSILRQKLGKRERIFPKVEEPVENSKDFLKKQRERLKKL